MKNGIKIVGFLVGYKLGDIVATDGLNVGYILGLTLGKIVGFVLGTTVGIDESAVGYIVGGMLGTTVDNASL